MDEEQIDIMTIQETHIGDGIIEQFENQTIFGILSAEA